MNFSEKGHNEKGILCIPEFECALEDLLAHESKKRIPVIGLSKVDLAMLEQSEEWTCADGRFYLSVYLDSE